MDRNNRTGWEGVLIILLSILAIIWIERCTQVREAEAHTGHDHIPPAAEQYRRQLTREVRYYWSLFERVSTFGAQIHRESYWRERAKSHVGAEGLGQIMPKTGAWLGNLYPADLGPSPRPLDPWWNLKAMVLFDRRLYVADKEAQGVERYAFMLARYNAGSGNIAKEQREAERRGLDRSVWGESVETVCKRRVSACKETEDYVRAILFRFEPLYRGARW
jgi:membrane-bound lytic murein transglycosylase MltF